MWFRNFGCTALSGGKRMAEKDQEFPQMPDKDPTQGLPLKKDLEELTSENCRLVAELKECFKTASVLKHRNIALGNENRNLKNQLDVLGEKQKQHLIDMENLRNDHQTEMKRIVARNSDYSKQIKDLEEEIDNLKKHLSGYRAEIEQADEQNAYYLKQITELEQEIDSLNRQQSGYQTEIEGIAKQNADYLKQITELEEEVDNLNIELSILKKAQSSSIALEQANKEKERLSTEINTLNQKISNLTGQISLLKERRNDLLCSNSYQIGQIFAKAISEPGVNTIMMPFRFFRFVASLLFKKMKFS